ncbi:MAG: methyltransferase domain-containing protein [Acidobacteria bacterium]|nr:methyltransferase domain-containing protein [Acidobacteriota bacterium]
MSDTIFLVCSVRGCGERLVRKGRRLACDRGHSFDVARSGYVNLLQPQDKKSKAPGDTAEAVAARRRLHDRGVTDPLLAGVRAMLRVDKPDRVLDAGCGDGFYLGNLGVAGCGVDISIPAVDAAARRYPECEWIVANADRAIPYSNGAFDAVMSITARMNVAEFRRVLREDGRLLVAVPAPEDFIELRGKGRDRRERTIEEFSTLFDLAGQERVATAAELDADGVRDALLAIYRPMQSRPAEASRVTMSLDLLLFRQKRLTYSGHYG